MSRRREAVLAARDFLIYTLEEVEATTLVSNDELLVLNQTLKILGDLNERMFNEEHGEDEDTVSHNRAWKPGDPCGVCGSTRTVWGDVGEGAVCRGCGAHDSDE